VSNINALAPPPLRPVPGPHSGRVQRPRSDAEERGVPGARAPGRSAAATVKTHRYCLSLMSTPPVASASLTPWVVAVRVISTPFWFLSATALAPPPTVTPAPAAT